MMARSTTAPIQRPDTLMQDRSPPARRNLLATRGRTIHSGQNRKSWLAQVTSVSPPTTDIRQGDRHVQKMPKANIFRPIRYVVLVSAWADSVVQLASVTGHSHRFRLGYGEPSRAPYADAQTQSPCFPLRPLTQPV